MVKALLEAWTRQEARNNTMQEDARQITAGVQQDVGFRLGREI